MCVSYKHDNINIRHAIRMYKTDQKNVYIYTDLSKNGIPAKSRV